MAAHNQATKHTIALSFSDASFWCYECESYIDSPSLKKARVTLSNSKFS
jgi:histone deacetylase 6